MPRIGGRDINDCLPMSIGCVTNMIMKTIVAIDFPELDLANCKSKPVPNVVGRLSARSRTPVHHNSHESSLARALGDSDELISATSIIDVPRCEWLPVVLIIWMQVHRIVLRPVFDVVAFSVRRSPMNTDGVDRLCRAKIDHHPLRMRIFSFAGEMRIEIRITFPE